MAAACRTGGELHTYTCTECEEGVLRCWWGWGKAEGERTGVGFLMSMFDGPGVPVGCAGEVDARWGGGRGREEGLVWGREVGERAKG